MYFKAAKTLIIFTLLIVYACKKDKLELQVTKIPSGTTHDLHDIFFTNKDTGYIVGGSRYETGIMLKTTDGGNSWQIDSIIDKILFGVFFLNSQQGYAAGYAGNITRTFDGGQNWDLYQRPHWLPLYDVYFVNDSIGFAVGGKGYEEGLLYKTMNGGNTWDSLLFNNELRTVHFTDEQTGYAGGYGILLKTEDAGLTWDTTAAKGDFFMAANFTNYNNGYLAGYNGSILKTNDAGNSWENVKRGNNPISQNTKLQDIFFYNSYTGVTVGYNGAFLKTDDGGSTWIKAKSFSDENLRAVWMMNDKKALTVGDNGNIYLLTE